LRRARSIQSVNNSDRAAGKRAMDAMMKMQKIETATIEVALRGETVVA
jgi:hypothetical protein